MLVSSCSSRSDNDGAVLPCNATGKFTSQAELLSINNSVHMLRTARFQKEKQVKLLMIFFLISSVWLDETVIGVLFMVWPVLVCCVLAQVRPLSDSWQGIRVTAGLVPAAQLLSLFNSLRPSTFNSLGRNHANSLLPHCILSLEWRQYTERRQSNCSHKNC